MSSYIFLVEGNDDEKFVREVLSSEIDGRVEAMKYSETPHPKVNKHISAYTDLYQNHYFVTDLDAGQDGCHCCDDREAYEHEEFEIDQVFDIFVAVDAIEAWYLAGVPDSMRYEHEIPLPDEFETVDKDRFDSAYRDSQFTSKQRFKVEIRQNYHHDLARDRNDSFDYVASAVGL